MPLVTTAPTEKSDPPVVRLAKPSASPEAMRLIHALRSPLPPGFGWDFRRGDTCACGLALRLGIDLDAIGGSIGDLRWFDHPFSAVERVGVVRLYGVPARDVTPAMVADALEKLITAGDALERLTSQAEG